MKILVSLLLLSILALPAVSQNTGIGTSNPLEKLDVNGAIKIGTSAGNNAGSLRYDGGTFQGNNGSAWQAFTQLPAGTLVASVTNPNTALQNAGFSFFSTFFLDKSTIATTVPNTWLNTQLFGAPPATSSFASVWTGTEMIVWGGYGTDFTNTGARYNPVTNSWSAMAASPLSGRYFPSIVWTGTVAIIWGGYGNAGYCGDGATYNPATNTWALISNINAPSARYANTCVWTGTEMIIWGGYTIAGRTATGARYNLLANSWTALPAAPITERSFHTAVFTGTQMIIWAGEDNVSRKNDGAMYNTGTNTWTATSVAGNVPAVRQAHTAIWTGTEMIVWGGSNTGVGFINSGGRFSPATNTWGAVTSLSGAPALRSEHIATWTGSEMIIWGGTGPGSTSFTYYNNGGRYNPVSNSWSNMAGAGAPEGRTSHGAVWTGNQLIIFGGFSPSAGTFNSGGRYIVNSQPNITVVEPAVLYLFMKN